MKNIFLTILAVCTLALAACSGKDDEPVNVATGLINVEVTFNGDDAPAEPVDMSEYVVVVIPQSGWMYTDYWKNIKWPLTAAVGRYAVAISSPIVSETYTEVKQYYGEVPVLTVAEDVTTEVTVQMKLTTFKKD